MNFNLSDVSVDFHEDHHSGKTDTLIIEHTQEIPNEWLQANRIQRANSIHTREGDFMHVASVPVALAEMWLRRDNYDVYKEPVTETLKRLRQAEFDDFILTNKRV